MVEKVKAVEEEGDWYVIPNRLLTEFNSLVEQIYLDEKKSGPY